jgi:hypothetical protein
MVEQPQRSYEIEKTNLEAHVDLCAERYFRLEQRLEGVEVAIKDMQSCMVEESKKTSKIIIGSAATVIGGLLSTVVALIMML